MFEERTLDLEWSNAISRGDDYIVSASHKPEIFVIVTLGSVTGQKEVIAIMLDPRSISLLWSVPVSVEVRRWSANDSQLAYFIGR